MKLGTGWLVGATAVVAGGIGVLIGKYAMAAPVPAAGALGYRAVPTGAPRQTTIPKPYQNVSGVVASPGLTTDQCQAWFAQTAGQKLAFARAEMFPSLTAQQTSVQQWQQVSDAVQQRDDDCSRVLNQYTLGTIRTAS